MLPCLSLALSLALLLLLSRGSRITMRQQSPAGDAPWRHSDDVDLSA
jgi:hypothetical protein